MWPRGSGLPPSPATCWITSLIFLPPVPRSHSPPVHRATPGPWHTAATRTASALALGSLPSGENSDLVGVIVLSHSPRTPRQPTPHVAPSCHQSAANNSPSQLPQHSPSTDLPGPALPYHPPTSTSFVLPWECWGSLGLCFRAFLPSLHTFLWCHMWPGGVSSLYDPRLTPFGHSTVQFPGLASHPTG